MDSRTPDAATAKVLGSIPMPFCASRDDAAPSFQADAYYQGKEVKVSIEMYRGHWLILFFYSSDFTFV